MENTIKKVPETVKKQELYMGIEDNNLIEDSQSITYNSIEYQQQKLDLVIRQLKNTADYWKNRNLKAFLIVNSQIENLQSYFNFSSKLIYGLYSKREEFLDKLILNHFYILLTREFNRENYIDIGYCVKQIDDILFASKDFHKLNVIGFLQGKEIEYSIKVFNKIDCTSDKELSNRIENILSQFRNQIRWQ